MATNPFDDIDALARWTRENNVAAPDVTSMQTVREGLLKQAQASSVLRQYVRHIGPERGVAARNTLPWHAEGERQYATFLTAMVGAPDGPRALAGDLTPDPSLEPLMLGGAMFMLTAQVYLWFQEIEDLADAAPLPRHVVSRDCMPYPVMFWSRDVARGTDDIENNWTFLQYTPDGIRMLCDISYPGQARCDLTVADIPFGLTYPDDYAVYGPGPGYILARLAFLNSPYVDPEVGRLPRAWRRELARKGEKPVRADPEIRVVRLRRDAAERVAEARDAGLAGAERQSHWWVSGHMRAQWYPSKQAHEVIWIAPYLKGNLQAPLKKKLYVVAR